MTVDLLEEEMNILNLNGLSVQDVTDNINYLRMTGLEDNVIREQYDDLLSELKPITKTSPNDTQNIKEWTNKGSITPFEYGRRKSLEFDEKYNNINEYANLSNIELKLKNTDYNNTVDERIAKNKKAKEERNKRVNEGNASFLDRTGAFLDRWGKASLEAQLKDDKQTMPISPLVERKKRTEKRRIGIRSVHGRSRGFLPPGPGDADHGGGRCAGDCCPGHRPVRPPVGCAGRRLSGQGWGTDPPGQLCHFLRPGALGLYHLNQIELDGAGRGRNEVPPPAPLSAGMVTGHRRGHSMEGGEGEIPCPS